MPLKKRAVNPDKQALAEVRAQIDQIDGALYELLSERAELIDSARKLKGKQHLFIRPGREAQMLRSLMSRPKGKLPEGLVVRLWREIISAFTLQEGTFKVGVYVAARSPDLWDVARDHYGSFTPLVEFTSSKAVMKALQAGKIQVAVIPPPVQDEKDLWWPLLADIKSKGLTIFQSLPFETVKVGRSNARRAMPKGLIVGKLYPELTGDDRSFLALQCVHVPEAEMKRLLSKAGYKVRQLLTHSMGRGASSPTAYFAEVDGFVGRADTRLGRIKAMMGSRLKKLSPLGGYPLPLKGGKR